MNPSKNDRGIEIKKKENKGDKFLGEAGETQKKERIKTTKYE